MTYLKMESLDFKIEKMGNVIDFTFPDETGEAVVTIQNMGDSAKQKLSLPESSKEKYADLAFFYPNGIDYALEPPLHLTRKGRGSALMKKILNYCNQQGIYIFFCCTTSQSMQQFLRTKFNFTHLGKNNYVLVHYPIQTSSDSSQSYSALQD